MIQTNGQTMGSESSREGIQNPLIEFTLYRSGFEAIRYEDLAEKDLDFEADPISEGVFRAPSETGRAWRGPFVPAPSETHSNPTFDAPHASIHEEFDQGCQKSYDRRSIFLDIESRYRRDSVERTSLLQQALHDIEKCCKPHNTLEL
ncbi:hypothetical protein AYI70_g8429 [Smittium culicis]|uniref:Uncharacterized protein n=1 Tax=Smittium culicis TaxID=133412 RepID=A0A1R1XFX4_9FUNG|nr:hypothetical protein AYI70_g8429 [Smittium culicis]